MLKKYFMKNALIWSIINFIYLIFSANFLQYIRLIAGRTYNPIPLYIVATLVPFLFGVLLRLPILIERWEAEKQFNWIKFLNQGLLALILTLSASPIFYIINLPLFRLYSLVGGQEIILYLSAAWLGVCLTDCIKATKKDFTNLIQYK
ncbi:MAG: hypothetical protein JJT76_04740 [Clostridiaceae bacterium]|nr:hypothetical protein [Clostridiaceae bacterium]